MTHVCLASPRYLHHARLEGRPLLILLLILLPSALFLGSSPQSAPLCPLIPVSLLPFLALVLLAATFALAFYFTTYVVPLLLFHISLSYSLPKDALPLRETAVAATASTLAGFGVVALFCTAGVYV
jgi:hypothetical protein